VNVALDAARHHFLVTMMALGMDQQRRDQQRLLHHQTVHVFVSVNLGSIRD
jgi:hypothetical protein